MFIDCPNPIETSEIVSPLAAGPRASWQRKSWDEAVGSSFRVQVLRAIAIVFQEIIFFHCRPWSRFPDQQWQHNCHQSLVLRRYTVKHLYHQTVRRDVKITVTRSPTGIWRRHLLMRPCASGSAACLARVAVSIPHRLGEPNVSVTRLASS
jgi:hypothetical protein